MFLSGSRILRLFCTQTALLAGVLCLPAQQQTLVFEHVGLEHGLPEGQILGLLQDREGYIWFGIYSGLVRYDGYNFAQYTHLPNDSNSLSNTIAFPKIEDREGFIWAASHTGLNRWDRRTNRFRRFYHDPEQRDGLPGNEIVDVFQAKNGVIWVATDRGLAWYDGAAFHKAPLLKKGLEVTGLYVYSIAEDDAGELIAGTRHGMATIDQTKKQGFIQTSCCINTGNPTPEVWKVYKGRDGGMWAGTDAGLFWRKKGQAHFDRVSLPGTLREQAVRNMIEDGQGFLWIATLNNSGIFRLNPSSGAVEHFKHSASNAFGICSNDVREFMIDRLNQLWIGTYNGLNKVDLTPPRFALLQQEPGNLRPENQIYKAYADREGGLWYCNYGQQGFYAKKPGERAQETNFLPFRVKPTQLENFCSNTDGEMWIATDPNGILRYKQGHATWLDEKLTNPGDSLALMGFYYMQEDPDAPGYMWLSSKNGLCKLDKKTLKRTFFPPFRDISDLQSSLVVNGMQAPDGYIYVLFETHFNGKLARFNKSTGHYRRIETAKAFPDGKNTIHIRQFTFTPDGTIWMATAAGLGKFDPRTETFSLLTTADGLVANNLMGIAADRRGNVWLKSLRHLSKYAPRLDSFWHFSVTKDMKEFNAVGAAVAPDGRIFFYGNNGFYAFYPDSVRLDMTRPRVVLTDFKVLNHSRMFGDAPENIREITLKHGDNVFSFEYAALHFRDPANNHYRYRMQGFDKTWVNAGTDRKVTYTNLDAGRYAFYVEACNADGVWCDQPLTIHLRILPPWWATWWAGLLYAAATFGAVFALYRFQLRRRLEHAETLRLQELDAVKTRLYTNITHEFRTPLTVILGMARQVLGNPRDYFSQGLDMILRNGQNLLELVNQMLDLSKLESGRLTLRLRQGDVLNFLKYLAESFHSLAGTKDIQIHFLSDAEAFTMDFDAERLQQVISNLLSNAIKFTPEGGHVYFSVAAQQALEVSQGKTLIVKIKDTGIGISEADLPHIFDRFYQADDSHTRRGEGTGIGLALTKELVKLMGGEIAVKSPVAGGSEFILTLPARRQAGLETHDENNWQPQTPAPAHPRGAPLPVPVPSDEKPLLLLAEDNADVVAYLASCLVADYRLAVAKDGQEALDMAFEITPDLVVADVMMPRKDGFELCTLLKKDARSSHIPVVMLTAKADLDSKLEGLERGADAYLAKPFHREELLLRIRKLLELRRQLQLRYLSKALHPEKPEEPQALPLLSPLEDAFVAKARAVVERHLEDADFDVEKLCHALYMSHSQVHRKLSALTGCSANKFIRLVRLGRAKELLRNPALSITAVAFDSGFNDPSYFGKVFKQEFGMTPVEWREKSHGWPSGS